MAFRWYLTVNIIALIFLGISFLLALALKRLMGKGKDTAPVKVLMIIIGLNGLLCLLLLAGGWFKYVDEWVNYARLTDMMIMIIGVVLTAAVAKIYLSYKKLIKKHEPEA